MTPGCRQLRLLGLATVLALFSSACGGSAASAPSTAASEQQPAPVANAKPSASRAEFQAADKVEKQAATKPEQPSVGAQASPVAPAPSNQPPASSPSAAPLVGPPPKSTASLVLSQDGGTVYDSVNNVTWLADADLAASNRFGLPAGYEPGQINPTGSMSYQSATAWVAAMNAADYLGHSNWQLPVSPTTDKTCTFTGPHGEPFGFDCSGSALGSLYYRGLALRAPNTAVPIPDQSAGPFTKLQPYFYWTQTSPDASGHSTFSFNTGIQSSNTKPNYMYVLPAIPGKIPGTPPSGNGLQVSADKQAVYDPVTNVTWLTNANLASSNTFGLPACKDQGTPKECVNAGGAMNWDSASTFVSKMSAAAYLGQKNWQLPTANPNCGVSYVCAEPAATNPFGSLFYGVLGLQPGVPAVSTPNIATGPFTHIQPYLYWSCGGSSIQGPCGGAPPVSGFQFSFSFGNGFQGTDVFKNDLYVTAYFPGAR